MKKTSQRKYRAMAQSMLIVLLGVMSLATDGFGAAPPSQFSEEFRETLGEALPPSMIEQLNSQLKSIEVISIPVSESTVNIATQSPANSNAGLFNPSFLNLLGSTLPPELINYINSITTLAIPIHFVDATIPPSPETTPTLSAKEIAETLVASLLTTGTPDSALPTDARQTAISPSASPSASPTATPEPSQTSAASPSPTTIWYPWTSTPKSPSAKTATPTQTPSPTATSTATATPTSVATWDFNITNIALDNLPGTTITVYPGQTVLLDYDYQVWTSNQDNLVQLLSGINNTVNADGSCAYNGIPGISPGVTGNVNDRNLTAPTTPGTYDIEMGYDLQLNCADAVTNYTNLRKKVIGTITVIPAPPTPTPPSPTTITMYNAGLHNGDMGGRSGTDALCAGSRPAGYTKSSAFISATSGDAIADMPSNYSVPTNITIESIGGIIIANDWSDLLDGSIDATLGGVDKVVSTGTFWWSGSENDTGINIVGTSSCTAWTQATSWGGNYGLETTTGAGWMTYNQTTCDQSHYLLCIAYP